MSALIDAIGALVIGGLLLLIMVNSIFNIHAQSVDIEQQLILSQISENVARIIGGYLALAGAGEEGQILPTTGDHRLNFEASDTTFTSIIRNYDIIQGDSTNFGFPLEVFRDNIRIMGPFYLADSLKITYYNEKNNVIPLVNHLVPPDSLGSLRYMKLEMEFFYDAFSPPDIPGMMRDDPKNRIVMWRYFINMYL